MQKKIISGKTLLALFALTLSLNCARRSGFALENHYAAPSFSGRSLSGATIVLSPVLVDGGFLSGSDLEPEALVREVRKERSDLHIISSVGFESKVIVQSDSAALEIFYRNLYESQIFELNMADAIWSSVGGTFLFVLRLTSAAHIQTFDQQSRRRLTLEGELWSPGSVEVLWRASVHGVSVDGKESDSKFISQAVRNLFASLPQVKPGYGHGEW